MGTKKHFSIALRAAVFCSLCNLVVAYDPTKVDEVVCIFGDSVHNGRTGKVVSFNKSEHVTVVKLDCASGEDPLTIPISNANLTPPRPKMRQMNANTKGSFSFSSSSETSSTRRRLG